MRVAHFYHVYADGSWREPVAEHVRALVESRFEGPVMLGIVGAPERRKEALRAFEGLPRVEVIKEAERGWEQVTLIAARLWAQACVEWEANWGEGEDWAVMYAHTKGSSDPSELNMNWRGRMTRGLIWSWASVLGTMEACSFDLAGCFYLDETHPTWPNPIPHFSGNYWMARCEHLAQLPPLGQQDRFQAEMWVCQGNPTIFKLNPR